MPEEAWQQYEVAYKEAARALDEQLKVFEGVQARTGTLAAFAGLLVLALLVLRHPKPVTAASPSRLIPTYIERAGGAEAESGAVSPADAATTLTPLALLYRDLSLYMEESHHTNTQEVERLRHLFDGAAALLMLEILAWVIEVA